MKHDNPARRPLMTMAGVGAATLHLPSPHTARTRKAAERHADSLWRRLRARYRLDLVARLPQWLGWYSAGEVDDCRAYACWVNGVWVPVDRKALEVHCALLLAARAGEP